MDIPEFTDEQRHKILCISESYQRLTGRPLVACGANTSDPVQTLWTAPFVIVAHGTEPDPIFYFGNRVALSLFEMDFNEFARLPSRLSAEPLLREERMHVLDRVTRDGIIENYACVRVSSTGKRFQISDTAVWNLADETGTPVGQAAAFSEWVHIAKDAEHS